MTAHADSTNRPTGGTVVAGRGRHRAGDGLRHRVSRLRRELRQAPDRVWFDAHRDHLLSTLRDAMAEPETAVALFAEVWPAVPDDVDDVDDAWSRGLLDLGVALAERVPTSLPLGTAFRHAAEFLRARGALRAAAVAGMRELAIRRLHDDPDATAAALYDLAATYRTQGRMHRVVGCVDEVLELYLLCGDRPGIVRTLVHLGSLMLEVGRFDAAVRYLSRADREMFQDPPDRTGQAGCLALLGRALWLSGDQALAHRRFNRALALLVGTDDGAAQRVRDLRAELDRPPGPEAPHGGDT